VILDQISKESKPGYLEGQLLIATPVVTGSCFYRSVIYVCVHNEEGAMGIVINQIINNVTIRDILKQLGIQPGVMKGDLPVHFGGPVDSARGFVLHTDDYKQRDTVIMKNGIALTSNIDVLKDLTVGVGPSRSIMALGYAGWNAGQLDVEIHQNSWLTAPASPDLVFENGGREKWFTAAESIGVDLLKLSPAAGHA